MMCYFVSSGHIFRNFLKVKSHIIALIGSTSGPRGSKFAQDQPILQLLLSRCLVVTWITVEGLKKPRKCGSSFLKEDSR